MNSWAAISGLEARGAACRRCTARYGITEPAASHLPPHQTVCRRHRLWTSLAARSRDGQLEISPSPRYSRPAPPPPPRPAAHPWRLGDAARDATGAIHHGLRCGTWIPGQQRRMRRRAPSTWQQALAGVLGARPGRPNDGPSRSVVEIAIYPDVVWLAARSLQAHSPSTAPR